jgi:VCBS repeat-containing protein
MNTEFLNDNTSIVTQSSQAELDASFLLNNVVSSAWNILADLSNEEETFLNLLNQVFIQEDQNTNSDYLENFHSVTLDIIEQLKAGSLLGLNFAVASDVEMEGHLGAYAVEGADGKETIYLNAEWLLTADSASIQAVLLEEIGHALDQRLNGGIDTIGDEGELFSNLVLGNQLTDEQLAIINSEDDSALLTIDGVQVSVESAISVVGGTSTYDGTTDVDVFSITGTGGGTFSPSFQVTNVREGDQLRIGISGKERWIAIDQSAIIDLYDIGGNTNVDRITISVSGTTATITLQDNRITNFSNNDVEALINNLFYKFVGGDVTDGGTRTSITITPTSPTGTGRIINFNKIPTLTPPPPITYEDTANDDSFLNTSATLTATDLGDTLTYSINGQVSENNTIDSVSYDRKQVGTYGTLYLNSATGAYVFVPNDGAIEGLKSNDSEGFTLTVTDSFGATDSETLTINLTGANDTPDLDAPSSIDYIDTANDDTFSNTTGSLTSSDRDDDETLTYSIDNGTSGSFTIDSSSYDYQKIGTYGTLYLDSATGEYVYVADDGAIEGLKGNDSEEFTLTVTDGSSATDSETLTIDITGANDTPDLDAPLTIDYIDTANDDTFSNTTGSLTSSDRDDDETLTYSIDSGTSGSFTVDSNSYDYQKIGTYGTLYLDSATGEYVYVADDTAIEGLKSNDSEGFTLTVTDSFGATDSETLTINLTGANDTPDLDAPSSIDYIDTANDDTFSNTTGSLTSSDRDDDETLTYSIDGEISENNTIDSVSYDRKQVGTYGTLYLNSSTGAYVFVPNDGAIEGLKSNDSEGFTLTVTDSFGATDSETLTINLTGANDTPDLDAPSSIDYIDTANDDTFSNTTGSLTSSDRDDDETLTYSIDSGTSGSFTVDSNSYDYQKIGTYGTLYLNSSTGEYVYVADDTAIEGLKTDDSEEFTLTVTDGSSATDSETLTINLTGANDTPDLVTPSSIDYIDTANDDTFSNTTDSLTSSDRDDDETLTYSIDNGTSGSFTVDSNSYDYQKIGTYGTLYLDSATGEYVYVADDTAIEGLKTYDSEEFTLIVTDGSSATDSETLTIDITGANDTPETEDKTVEIAENKIYTFSSADFAFSDRDNGDSINGIIVQPSSDGQLKYNGVAITTSDYFVSIDDINASLLTFEPDTDEYGDDYATFNFQVVDQSEESSEAKTMTIDVFDTSTVTFFGNSGGQTFDFNNKLDGQQFRLIFTPDGSTSGTTQYKLTSTNTGHFSLGLVFNGSQTGDLVINIPTNFVLRNAPNAIQIWDDVDYDENENLNLGNKIGNYNLSTNGVSLSGNTLTIKDFLINDDDGLLYARVLFDFNRVGTTGYTRALDGDGGAGYTATQLQNLGYTGYDAVKTGGSIDDLTGYSFSASFAGQNIGDPITVYNQNEFKKSKVLGVLVADKIANSSELDDVLSARLYKKNTLVETVNFGADGLTNEEGWFAFNYLHSGKQSDYKIELFNGANGTGSKIDLFNQNGGDIVGDAQSFLWGGNSQFITQTINI